MTTKQLPKIPYSYIRSALRRLWMHSPIRRNVRAQAFVMKEGRSLWYMCDECLRLVMQKETAVDHIEPVGPTPGSRNAPPGYSWDTFMERLFCDASNLRVVCKECHKEKTAQEKGKKK